VLSALPTPESVLSGYGSAYAYAGEGALLEAGERALLDAGEGAAGATRFPQTGKQN